MTKRLAQEIGNEFPATPKGAIGRWLAARRRSQRAAVLARRGNELTERLATALAKTP